jgi:ribosome-associated protein
MQKTDLYIKPGITIPEYELEITASRAGGPGGQHVNKTNSRITVRWHVANSHALPPQLKDRLLEKLAAQISAEGFLIVHNSTSRSQQQNKIAALANLAQIIRNGLYVPKKRIPTKISATTHEVRLQKKTQRGHTKKLRQKKISYDE